MKKLFTLFLALVASVGTMLASVTIDGITYNLNETELSATVTKSSTHYSGRIVIPESVTYETKTYRVIDISQEAFRYNDDVTSIEIPGSVPYILRFTFERCSSLKSVTIGNGVTIIGSQAFAYCTGLTSVEIPNSVTEIEGSAFADCSSLKSVTIGNGVTEIDGNTFSCCKSLTSITIPNSVTRIHTGAFSGCTGLTSVTIGNSVTQIGPEAFAYCERLTSILCWASKPPVLYDKTVFRDVDCSRIPLCVPASSIETYKKGSWKVFNPILPISAEATETNMLIVEPSANTAEVVWPSVSGAYTYELVIKDKNGNLICTLIFNAQGLLTSIAFNAPARDNSAEQTQAAGFSYTIAGLEEGTDYNLTIIAKNSSGQTLDTKSASFTANDAQAIDQITNDQSPITNKVMKDGQLLIHRGDKTYTATGAEVK